MPEKVFKTWLFPWQRLRVLSPVWLGWNQIKKFCDDQKKKKKWAQDEKKLLQLLSFLFRQMMLRMWVHHHLRPLLTLWNLAHKRHGCVCACASKHQYPWPLTLPIQPMPSPLVWTWQALSGLLWPARGCRGERSAEVKDPPHWSIFFSAACSFWWCWCC